MKKMNWTFWGLVGAFLLLGAADIGLGFVGLIPIVGDVFAGLSNGVTELFQTVVFALIAMMAYTGGRK